MNSGLPPASKNINNDRPDTYAYNNVCAEEQNISLKCIWENYYDRSKCEDQFENYKLCKTFWRDVVLDRRRNRIEPALPRPEDRERIKREYMSKPSFKL